MVMEQTPNGRIPENKSLIWTEGDADYDSEGYLVPSQNIYSVISDKENHQHTTDLPIYSYATCGEVENNCTRTKQKKPKKFMKKVTKIRLIVIMTTLFFFMAVS
ncbi:unnamed protein product, partial [Owenia fusiformis]